jgi:hypothetical protein
MKKIFVLFVSFILLVSLAACNLPTEPSTEIAPELMTAAALTVQAVLTPLNSPTAAASSTNTVAAGASNTLQVSATAAMTKSPTPTITPTYSVPMLEVNEATNCRSGPGQNYEIIFTFLSGATTEIVGQYPQDNYWVVKLPGGSGTCWVWGGYSTTTGSAWVVPTTTAPPTTTPTAPDAPTILSWNYDCPSGTAVIKWSDRSDGEEGFRVVRDDQVVAQLPPNTTSYTDNIYGIGTAKVTYYVEVFAGNLTARSSTFSFSCQ